MEPRQTDEQIDFGKFPIGKPLFLYQYHSCDTAAKFPVSLSKNIRLMRFVRMTHRKSLKVVTSSKLEKRRKIQIFNYFPIEMVFLTYLA